jgi:adenylate cyclase
MQLADSNLPPAANEAVWRAIFETGDPKLETIRRRHSQIPSAPRCRLCLAPFGGIGGFVLRWRGKGRAMRNPAYCDACDKFLEAFPGGAEVRLSIVFADVRGSSQTASELGNAAFADYMDRFFRAARQAITETGGFVAEFRGDCAVGTFPQGLCGADHPRQAIACARLLLGDNAPRARDGSPIPIGVGVHTGRAFLGTRGGPDGANRQDVGVLGENANVAAFLSQGAAAGEAWITEDACAASGGALASAPRRDVSVKGAAAPIAIRVLKSGGAPTM